MTIAIDSRQITVALPTRFGLSCILAIALLPACNGERPVDAASLSHGQKLVEQNARLQRELDEANRKIELQSRYTADATRTLNELQDHLATIAALEGEVRGGTEGDHPLTRSRREKMMAAVQQMEAEVAHQRELIAGFRDREKQYTEKVAELGAAITRFERLITTKNEEIDRLRRELRTVTTQVETLTADARVRESELAHKQQALESAHEKVQTLEREARTAAYIVASIKQLRSVGIVQEKRVLLSRVWTVSPAIDVNRLTTIDRDDLRELSIVAPRDRIEMISPHPPGTYTLLPESRTQSVLTITDPERFWTTRLLVIGIR